MCGEWHWKPWRKEKLETHWKPGRQQSETRTKVQFHVRFERAPIGCRRRSGATQPKQREACAPAHLIGQKPRKCTNVTTETDDGLSIPRPDYDGCGTIAWLLKREEKKKKSHGNAPLSAPVIGPSKAWRKTSAGGRTQQRDARIIRSSSREFEFGAFSVNRKMCYKDFAEIVAFIVPVHNFLELPSKFSLNFSGQSYHLNSSSKLFPCGKR